jgi:tail assembly chaperone E/41/14-like protein
VSIDKAKISEPVVLEEPIVRGEEKITELKFRRPHGGELRGISMGKLGQMDFDEVRKLIPRISMPTITQEEVDQMDSADIMEGCDRIMDFLLSTQRKAELPTT